MSGSVVKRLFVDSKQGQLHLRHAGFDQYGESGFSSSSENLPVICLHMVPKSGRGYANLMAELAQTRPVIAPDYPGYGESDPYPEGQGVSIEDYAQTIYQMLSDLGISKVDLMGYHTGSMVSVAMASLYPDLVRKVVNISGPVLIEQEVADFHKYYEPIPLDKEGTRFRTGWERVIYYSGPGMTLEMAAISFAENLRGGERYEDGHYAAFEYVQTYRKKLTEIGQPVFMMNLKDDLFEHCKRAEAMLKGDSLYKEYPQWGHGFLDLWPKDVTTEINTFLDA